MSLNSKRGVTVIELLIIVAIIGVISTISMPLLSRALTQARAVAIIGDFRAVRVSAEEYQSQRSAWPAERGRGEAPPELAEYLQDQIDWSSPIWGSPVVYDWDNLIGQNQAEAGVAVGFSVRQMDTVLRQAVIDSWDGPLAQTWGDGVTFVIEPLAQ